LAWINRNDDVAAKKASRAIFAYANVLSSLTDAQPPLASIADSLYDRLVDFGGHPNPFSILTNLEMANGNSVVDFKLFYINAGGMQQNLALKTLGQVGLTCLYVFKIIWKERFDITGVSDQIEKERPGL
jgi:hypothetical protein